LIKPKRNVAIGTGPRNNGVIRHLVPEIRNDLQSEYLLYDVRRNSPKEGAIRYFGGALKNAGP